MKSTYYFYYHRLAEYVLERNEMFHYDWKMFYYDWKKHFDNDSLKLSIQCEGTYGILIISNTPFSREKNILKCFCKYLRPIFLGNFKKTTKEIDPGPETYDYHGVSLSLNFYSELVNEGYWTKEETEQIKKLCREEGEFWK